MTKRYKLLKDTPMDKCDTVFIKCKNLSGPDYYKPEEGDNKFTTDKGRIFLACIVESSPDWFQEIKEPKRIKITRMYDLNNAYQPQRVRTGFETSAPIPNDKFAAVKQAIENVLNEGEDVVTIKFSKPDTIRKCIVILVDTLLQYDFTDDRYDNSYPKYTQEQLNEEIEKAFGAARIYRESKGGFFSLHPGYFKHSTFQDYLSSLKK